MKLLKFLREHGSFLVVCVVLFFFPAGVVWLCETIEQREVNVSTYEYVRNNIDVDIVRPYLDDGKISKREFNKMVAQQAIRDREEIVNELLEGTE